MPTFVGSYVFCANATRDCNIVMWSALLRDRDARLNSFVVPWQVRPQHCYTVPNAFSSVLYNANNCPQVFIYCQIRPSLVMWCQMHNQQCYAMQNTSPAMLCSANYTSNSVMQCILPLHSVCSAKYVPQCYALVTSPYRSFNA